MVCEPDLARMQQALNFLSCTENIRAAEVLQVDSSALLCSVGLCGSLAHSWRAFIRQLRGTTCRATEMCVTAP